MFVLGGLVSANSVYVTSPAQVTINGYLSMTLTGAPVFFGNLNPNQGNTSVNPLVATIGPESNVPASISTEAMGPFYLDASHTFPVANMEWSITAIVTGGLGNGGTNYTTSFVQTCPTTISAGNSCTMYHWLSVPPATGNGAYSTTITILATG
jgi:hypothetical protein